VSEFHGGDVLAAGSHIEAQPLTVANGEVRHDLREPPDGAPGLQRELLIHRQVVDERTGGAQCAPAAGGRTRRVDHHRGTELVVLAQIAVDVAGQHQVDHRLSGPVLENLQAAVVDHRLRGIRRNREHRGMHIRLTDADRHGKHSASDGVL